MEAYKQLTYFTEAEIKNCLQKFSELLDPNTPFKSVHDPQARVLHDNVVNGLQELKVNPFAKRICQVFSPDAGQLMTFEEFLDMLSSLSVATPPTVRAEWAFKIFDSDGDQLLGENDIRSRRRAHIIDLHCLLMQEGGGCHHGDGGGRLQESGREGAADGCQERPQGDGSQPNWANFPSRVQADGGKVARLRQQLQNQALDCYIDNLYKHDVKCYTHLCLY